jgi:hypothetical protein
MASFHIPTESLQNGLYSFYDFFFYRKLASANKEITEPLLRELADTEEANRTGKMTVSYFVSFLSNSFCFIIDNYFYS